MCSFIFYVQASVVSNCKRLTVEFMHYIIEARALRKVLVAIVNS